MECKLTFGRDEAKKLRSNFRTARAILVFSMILHQSTVVKTQTLAPKTFERLKSSDGSEVCSGDEPSAAFNVEAGAVNTVCVPPCVPCAWRCTVDPDCVGFNCRTDVGLCQLFRYAPTNFTQQNSCTYFQVGTNIATVVVWTSFNLS